MINYTRNRSADFLYIYIYIGGDFGQPHGKLHVVLPTATPRVKQRTTSLNFTSADTLQCKALQIWRGGGGDGAGGCGDYLVLPIAAAADAISALSDGVGDDCYTTKTAKREVVVDKKDEEDNLLFSGFALNKDEDAVSLCLPNQSEEEMLISATTMNFDTTTTVDSAEIMAAYKRSLMQQACPSAVLVPNIPGVFPSDSSFLANKEGGHNKYYYLVFDERVLGTMTRFGWNRSHGVVKLMPLACALYDHWKAYHHF